jgi:hypothetical protein
MSLIGISAALIRAASVDDKYAQDLFEAVESDGESRAGLVNGRIGEDELAQLTPSEWQWYANWRQHLDGRLDRRLLDYLTDSVTTRLARFEVRALVLRDRRTNELALEYDRPPDGEETDDTIGLHWLSEQAQGRRVAFRPAERYWQIQEFNENVEPPTHAAEDESLPEQERRDPFGAEFFAGLRSALNTEWLELTTDALQCATDASWFLLRQLTSREDSPVSPFADERRGLVMERLAVFIGQRGLNPEWYQRGQPIRYE